MAGSIFSAKFQESSSTRFLTCNRGQQTLDFPQLQSVKKSSAIGHVIHFSHRSRIQPLFRAAFSSRLAQGKMRAAK
jgi:hypothetical protein